MKIQFPNEVCMAAAVLSSKCYSILTDCSSHSAMKCVLRQLPHDMYKDCIINKKCYISRIMQDSRFVRPTFDDDILSYLCEVCSERFSTLRYLSRHRQKSTTLRFIVRSVWWYLSNAVDFNLKSARAKAKKRQIPATRTNASGTRDPGSVSKTHSRQTEKT